MTKILFIEDEPNHILLYKTELESVGFGFYSAENFREATEIIIQNQPDLILLDILLPKENGLDILDKIKTDDRFKKIPVIVFTNYDQIEYKDRALKSGAIDFVLKTSITPREMVKKIKTILIIE